MQLVDIPIRENFEDQEGRFRNYDAANLDQRQQLVKQKHVDIRGFRQEDISVRMPMLYIDLLTMQILNEQTMLKLNGNVIIRRGEQWTQGTFLIELDRNNVHGMRLACPVGTTVTESVITVA